MRLDNPGPAPIYENESVPVEVYNALPPAAFTDLDLSGTVGTRAALVLLKILNNTGAACTFTFRRNGDADIPISGVQNSTNIGHTAHAYLITDTDDAGIIEWRAVAAGTAVIWVMSWMGE